MRNRKAAASFLLVLLTGCCLVTQGTHEEVEFTSQPPGAAFAVFKANPEPGAPGAKVPVYGGTTPKTVNMLKEDYRVVYTLEGFMDESLELKCQASIYFYGSLVMGLISGGIDWISGAWKEFDKSTLHVKLKPKAGTSAKYTFKIKSKPVGARIEVEGAHHGITSLEGTDVSVWFGSLQQEKSGILRLKGYEDYKFKLTRETPPLTAVLVEAPVPVTVRFSSNPPGAKVEIDGQYQGFTTPWDGSHEWKPSIKERTVKFTMDGYKDQVRKFTAESKSVAVDMEEILRPVPVQVETIPSGATIEVDGISLGESPAKVTLVWSVSRKSNRLIVSRPGYQSEDLTIEEDKTKEPLKVRLRPMLPKLP